MVGKHGDPDWIELRTPDMGTAAAFYSALFGWSWQAADTSGDNDYRIATVAGRPVAGLTATRDDAHDCAIWTVTFRVDDVDQSVANLEPAGGMLEYPPGAMEIFGPLEHIRDASGALATIWQSPPRGSRHITTTGIGAPVGYELMARRYIAAINFYRELFGWEFQELDINPDMHPVSDGHLIDRAVTTGGVPPVIISDANFLSDDTQSYWRFAIAVADLDRCCELAIENGGMVVEGARDTLQGRSTAIADPFGATVQILEIT